mgnify:CR=1 FL=1
MELRRPERAVANTTAENLRVGVLWGYAGLVDSLVPTSAPRNREQEAARARERWQKRAARDAR